ncbi:endonuclease domain-containing protein [Brevundimonas kwangchunensis]|uniref:Endonuclease domain-containing protein n=1 Tax=Brevundimonas kwangchunensis TaxID=322163 RepID=A0ABN1H136_9CAUL
MRSMVEGSTHARIYAAYKCMATPIAHERARGLRRPMSPPEARLWNHVRGHRLRGYKFRRQHPIGPYIIDFYCPAARLAVEVDGSTHDHPDRVAHDRRRTAWLATQGVRVIRIAARDVRDELDGVLAFIARVVGERIVASTPPPPASPAVPLPSFAGEVSD